jgi:dTDP-4-dehydrorhamnose 3,5-epimerase
VHFETRAQVITPPRFSDERGWFGEVYNEEAYARLGIRDRFVQDNHSLSRSAFTVRGLHFQKPPRAQAKLIRCLRGAIFDVAIDLRDGSPDYGRAFSTILSAENGSQFYVPVGFAHGFMTLSDDTEVAYKVSDFYAPAEDAGLKWNDPDLAIEWPLPVGVMPSLSVKDAALPSFAAFRTPFLNMGSNTTDVPSRHAVMA